MMPKNEPWMNLTLVKPGAMTDEECGELKAFVGEDDGPDPDELKPRRAFYDVQVLENGRTPFYVVGFVASLEDREAINAGRPVFIKIMAAGFPPIAVFTTDENGNVN